MSDNYVTVGGLRVTTILRDFVENEALASSGLDAAPFWSGFERIVNDMMPINRALLVERDRLQAEIDKWHSIRRGQPWDAAAYRRMLEQIGYLVAEPGEVSVITTGVDAEIATLSGPQLVVPITNARYALNAANARWGSLYDAYYGTDVLPGRAVGGDYDQNRGARVIAAVRELLDEFFPLTDGSHADAVAYQVKGSDLVVTVGDRVTTLVDPAQFRGYRGRPIDLTSVLLRRNGLHLEIVFDAASPIAATDTAGISDVRLESALTTIIDFEDSIAAVDAEDKVVAYRNWLGLNRGTLSDTFEKAGRSVTRTLAEDRFFVAADGTDLMLPGRSLLFVRNVGHLMTTDAILDSAGQEIGEGIMDAVITALCALPGIDSRNPKRNGTTGSIYIVKPKMHGPAEVALTVELFERVEQLLGLRPETLKLGLMDEERRTSANLKACIAQATSRLVFINTGFLDRSGDEIHTSMNAGPIVRKADMRSQAWISAYEDQNVDIGLEAGLSGRGQIGKGMWAMPDLMADMLAQKIGHPLSGASTAWVPSPTAATLHALHYLRVDVRVRQAELSGHRRGSLDGLLTVPIGDADEWTAAARQEEIDNNVQSLLGYVVRWVELGIGCSKVPDIHDVGLMEDRATLRISSQLLTNWLHHDVVSHDQVLSSLTRMAAVVDAQNASDPDYRPMAIDPENSIAFQSALELAFEGTRQPNGYTEPILHRRRREAKTRDRAQTMEGRNSR